jgi:hypothetical protein
LSFNEPLKRRDGEARRSAKNEIERLGH